MKKRKAEQDPVSDAEQQHQEEEDVSAEQQQHDASVNGTRHKLQPDKLRLHKEQTERKGAVHTSLPLLKAYILSHINRHRVHQPHPATHGSLPWVARCTEYTHHDDILLHRNQPSCGTCWRSTAASHASTAHQKVLMAPQVGTTLSTDTDAHPQTRHCGQSANAATKTPASALLRDGWSLRTRRWPNGLQQY